MEPATTNQRHWGWFLAWLVVGAGYSFGLLGAASIGLFVLPFPVVATIVLAKRQPGSWGVPGVISGFGLPALYVAYLNRAGPGTVCVTTQTLHQCDQNLNPLPWLFAGLVLVVAGAVTFTVRHNVHGKQAIHADRSVT